MIRRKLSVTTRLIPRQDLRACRNCRRTFTSDRLSVHQQICQNIKTKRPVFDAAQKRIAGTSLESFLKTAGKRQLQWRRGGGNYVKQKYAPPKNNWRQTHEELIQALQNARATSRIIKLGGNVSDLPPPPPSLNPDYIQCPHCLRRFNETAANRHIPQCVDYRHNKPNTNLPTKNAKPSVSYPNFNKRSGLK